MPHGASRGYWCAYSSSSCGRCHSRLLPKHQRGNPLHFYTLYFPYEEQINYLIAFEHCRAQDMGPDRCEAISGPCQNPILLHKGMNLAISFLTLLLCRYAASLIPTLTLTLTLTLTPNQSLTLTLTLVLTLTPTPTLTLTLTLSPTCSVGGIVQSSEGEWFLYCSNIPFS